MLRHEVKYLTVAGVAPRVWNASGTDDSLSRMVVLFLPTYATSQRSREDLMLLLLFRMDMFGN
jgi:hypothetical protein